MTSEVENFIKKAEDKLISSKILYDADQQATSVSASYYCMFLAAKALLIKKGCNVGKNHVGLIKQFSLKYVKEDIFDYNIYKFLAETQSIREEADYSDIDTITGSVALNKINQAELFLIESKKFLD